MSSAIISQVEMKVFEANLISTVVAASERDQEWTARKRELDRLENEGKKFPKSGRVKTVCSTIRIDSRSQTTKNYEQRSYKDITIRKWQGISDQKKPLKSSPGIFAGKNLQHG